MPTKRKNRKRLSFLALLVARNTDLLNLIQERGRDCFEPTHEMNWK
jgi:hypothetical protein